MLDSEDSSGKRTWMIAVWWERLKIERVFDSTRHKTVKYKHALHSAEKKSFWSYQIIKFLQKLHWAGVRLRDSKSEIRCICFSPNQEWNICSGSHYFSFSQSGRISSILATMRFCSAKGGRTIRALYKRLSFIAGYATPLAFSESFAYLSNSGESK